MPSQVSDIELESATGQDALLGQNRNGVISSTSNGDGVTSRMLDEKIPVGILETPAERKARKRSHYILFFTVFVTSIGFSIVLTGVWPYLQQLDPSVSKEFLGWVVAANPLGQMLASPIFGLWANKAENNRPVFIVTISFYVIGNVFYAILGTFGKSAKTVMILSRFGVGISSAIITVVRTYISASTTLSERTTAVSLISASQALGFIIGPALQTGIVALFSGSGYPENQVENSTASMQNSSAIQPALAIAFEIGGSEVTNMTMSNNSTLVETPLEDDVNEVWNMYSATGWFAALLGFINIFMFLPCIYQEYPIAAKEAQLQRRDVDGRETDLPKADYLMCFVILVVLFISLTDYVLLETLMVPMTMDLYAWSDTKAITVIGIGLSIAAAISVVVFSIVGVMSKRVDERKFLIGFGLIPMTLGTFCFFPMGSTYPKIQYCAVDSSYDFPLPGNLSDVTTLIPDNNKPVYAFALPDNLSDITTKIPDSIKETEDGLNADKILTTLTPKFSAKAKDDMNTDTVVTTLIPKSITTKDDNDTDTIVSTLTPNSVTETEKYVVNGTNKSEDSISDAVRNATNAIHVTESSVPLLEEDVENINNLHETHSTSENVSSHNTLSRRRRHVAVSSSCHDLGCPQQQSWCHYTPIIEQSQLGIASLIVVAGYPTCISILNAIYSKLLGPKPQGVWMGILTSSASFSRVLGPIAVSYVYTELGPRWTFGLISSLLASSVVLTILSYKRLVPMKIGNSNSNS